MKLAASAAIVLACLVSAGCATQQVKQATDLPSAAEPAKKAGESVNDRVVQATSGSATVEKAAGAVTQAEARSEIRKSDRPKQKSTRRRRKAAGPAARRLAQVDTLAAASFTATQAGAATGGGGGGRWWLILAAAVLGVGAVLFFRARKGKPLASVSVSTGAAQFGPSPPSGPPLVQSPPSG